MAKSGGPGGDLAILAEPTHAMGKTLNIYKFYI